jgi:hypothetical protein
MLTVTFVLPGCATIPVVTGFGWELSHVTVCPVDGVSVGVQAARAGSAGQTSAVVVSAKAEAVERKLARKCSAPLTICRSANRSEQDADCIYRWPPCAARKLAVRHNASQQRSTYHCDGHSKCIGEVGPIGLSLPVAEKAQTVTRHLKDHSSQKSSVQKSKSVFKRTP